MTILDANILIYAHNADDPRSAAMKKYLGSLFAGPDVVGLPWPSIWAFIRIATNARIFSNPFPAEELFQIVNRWLATPGVIAVQPGPRHASILERLVIDGGAVGPLLSDAVLAALAMEHGATLASTDRDFSRFSGLRWIDPLRAPAR